MTGGLIMTQSVSVAQAQKATDTVKGEYNREV